MVIFGALVVLTGATACIATPPPRVDVGVPIADPEHGRQVEEHWDRIDPALLAGEQSIVVRFQDWPVEMEERGWQEMLSLELAAGDAILDAGIGYLDGNGSDGTVYEVFFNGTDHLAMWSIIEPIYSDAPLAWSEVQGWDSLEAEEPSLLLTN